MRADLDLDLDLRLPRSPGLKELMRRLVFRSPFHEPSDERESIEIERLARLPNVLLSWGDGAASSCFWRLGGDLDLERFVDMVDTESADEVDSERERLRSSSFFFRISLATPFLRKRSFGTSVVSLGFSLGLRSCWVLEGRDVYGRS